VHVAGAYGPDKALARLVPEGEHHKDIAPVGVLPDGIEPGLLVLRIAVGEHERRAAQDVLDLGL